MLERGRKNREKARKEVEKLQETSWCKRESVKEKDWKIEKTESTIWESFWCNGKIEESERQIKQRHRERNA